MEWIKKISLRKSLFLVIIVAFAIGNMLNQLVLKILGRLTDACMCGGSLTAILMSIVLSFAVPLIIATVFYNIKLKAPLAQLAHGAKRIKENDLDFVINFSSSDELGQLCESFESMRAQLLKSNKELWQQMEERKRLNAAFAHDLRNPVTVLKGSAVILQKGLEQENLTAESAGESISLIAQYSARIESYIQAMTSIQKLEELAFTPKAIKWLSLTKELKSSLSIIGSSTGKKVEFFSGGEDRQINVDSYIIYNVAENLVNNALRHSQNNVTVDMSCDNRKISIRITDDGAGFSSHILKKGAAPFLRDINDPQGQNFGMGLYICHLLCKKHNGNLTLENHPHGAKATAKFYF